MTSVVTGAAGELLRACVTIAQGIVLLMCDGGAAPLLFKRMGRDPATLAGPMETSIQDVLGYGTFMLLGHLLLPLIDK